MVLGMSLSTFTMLHVIISLIGIVSGIVVDVRTARLQPDGGHDGAVPADHDPDQRHRLPVSVHKLLPSHIVGILSLVLLAIACLALYGMKLAGAWRWIYVVTALISLYLNVFVLVIQGFLKVAAARAGAQRAAERAAFAVVQGIVLLFFVVLIVGALRRFRPA